MATKDRERRSRTTKTAKPEPKADLLELGPDEGQEFLEFENTAHNEAVIKVIGVGGGGGNALSSMIASKLGGVEFIAANTDAQALAHNPAAIKVQLGAEVTRGLGCGANPDKGRSSALEARDRLREILEGTDMVFVTAGMGGGTGTGAAPIVGEVAREVGALTVGVVTKPFTFEGKVRGHHAERGIDELHQVVDTLITIPNQRLLALAGKQTGIKDAFKLADEVLLNAVRGISDLITIHGLINLDFADVRTVMNEAGVAMMGTGVGKGDTRAVDAARSAISSPLLEDLSIEGARGVLINITGGSDLSLYEVNEASTLVQEAAHEDANIIFGAVIDENVSDTELRVTVIATGLGDKRARRGRDAMLGAREEYIPNVHPLRPEPGFEDPAPAPAAERAVPVVESREYREPVVSESPRQSLELSGIESPFEEDELDVPAFIRKRGGDDEEEDDRESPAFLRRAQD